MNTPPESHSAEDEQRHPEQDIRKAVDEPI